MMRGMGEELIWFVSNALFFQNEQVKMSSVHYVVIPRCITYAGIYLRKTPVYHIMLPRFLLFFLLPNAYFRVNTPYSEKWRFHFVLCTPITMLRQSVRSVTRRYSHAFVNYGNENVKFSQRRIFSGPLYFKYYFKLNQPMLA